MTIKDKLLEPYFIEVDESNFTVCETKQSDPTHHMSKGEVTEREVSLYYFTDLSTAIKKIIHLKLARNQKTWDLKEWVKNYVNIQSEFKQFLQWEV